MSFSRLSRRKSKPNRDSTKSADASVTARHGHKSPPSPLSLDGSSISSRPWLFVALGIASFLPLSFLLLLWHSPVLNIDLNTRFQKKRLMMISASMVPLAFICTAFSVPVVAKFHLSKKISGYDLNKKGSPAGIIRIPESLGLAPVAVFVVGMLLFGCFYAASEPTSFAQYYIALVSIVFMAVLGYIDDWCDIPWRMKLLVPSVAALFVVMFYDGGTMILIPRLLQGYIGSQTLELGWIYLLYIALWVVFCPNAINIHAGINGLEVGQSVIICCGVLVLNVMRLLLGSHEDQQAHALSLYFMQLFLGVSLGLLYYNWYPSSVFVGDIYTCFSGMAIAVTAIYGHFSEMLLFFLLPQILNFLYSLPQLLKIVPCPRHRLPIFDAKTGLLTGSKDMNLLNLSLRLFGPSSEFKTWIRLMGFQVGCVGLGLGIIYLMITGWYKL